MLELDADGATVLRMVMTEPAPSMTTARLGNLFDGSVNLLTGPFPKESYQWHRLVPRAASAVRGRLALPVPATRSAVYLRARQRNGHMAWASPVFVNHR